MDTGSIVPRVIGEGLWESQYCKFGKDSWINRKNRSSRGMLWKFSGGKAWTWGVKRAVETREQFGVCPSVADEKREKQHKDLVGTGG